MRFACSIRAWPAPVRHHLVMTLVPWSRTTPPGDILLFRHLTSTVAALTVAQLVLFAVSQAAATPLVAPTVIELFQSQGCSSCPPANANINALADRPDLLVLSFGVTYWDQLGWRDTFASPQNTRRQYDYRDGLHRDNVATPQVVINGRIDVVGVDRTRLDQAISRAGTIPALITHSSGRIQIASSARRPANPADVWLVRYDPRVQQVSIRRGENGGRTLPHRHIVRQLSRLGAWTGSAQSYVIPPQSDPALRTAVLVQTRGGPILTAASL